MLVRSLDELTRADLPEAGGKGANLGELRRAHFSVPDGFVITSAAYALAAEAAGVTGETPATARVRLAASPVPAGIADAIREAYRALGAPEVAVRSSATAEDLPDPITGRRKRAAIEAVRGLGEQLVSGAVNPDRFVVNTRTGAVLERRGDILGDAELRELAALGARIEEHFGRPQDIEWAIDADGKIWIVQSRDITTPYPLPSSAPDDENDLRVYFSANVAQGVFDPFTPMGLQTFRLVSSAFATVLGRPVRDPAAGASLYAG